VTVDLEARVVAVGATFTFRGLVAQLLCQNHVAGELGGLLTPV
jgi:hypothetical protein